MANKSNNDNPNQKNKQPNEFLRYSGMATQMIAIILASVFGGIKADEYFGNEKPILTAILTVFGVFLSIYFVIKDFLKK